VGIIQVRKCKCENCCTAADLQYRGKRVLFRLLWVNGVKGVEIHRRFVSSDKTSLQQRVYRKTKTFKNVQNSVTDTEDPGRPSISISDDKQVPISMT